MKNNRVGFTVVELLVVLAILAILVGMIAPAVQAVREAARCARCKDNLRQLGLATQQYESTCEHLPGPWFNAPPDSSQYHEDRGLFVPLLPFIEETNRNEEICAAPTTFDAVNSPVLSEPVGLLSCPSASGAPVRLTEIASLFSGPGVPGNTAVTCDYIGNGGYIPSIPTNPALTDGPIGAQIPQSGIPRENMARISDGLSNTLLFWESIGGAIINTGGAPEFDVNDAAESSFVFSIYGPPVVMYPSVGVASSKSYLHSWAGLRIGNLWESSGRVVNVGNTAGQPCSRHPGGANAVLVDGSIRFLARNLSPEVGFALASARGREVPNE